MTFSDPVGWPDTAAREQGYRDSGRDPGRGDPDGGPGPRRSADVDLDLPPLPTLEPLPRVRPLSAMPPPSWDSEPSWSPSSDAAASYAAGSIGMTSRASSPPPPPAGHPAAQGQPAASAGQVFAGPAGPAPLHVEPAAGPHYAEPAAAQPYAASVAAQPHAAAWDERSATRAPGADQPRVEQPRYEPSGYEPTTIPQYEAPDVPAGASYLAFDPVRHEPSPTFDVPPPEPTRPTGHSASAEAYTLRHAAPMPGDDDGGAAADEGAAAEAASLPAVGRHAGTEPSVRSDSVAEPWTEGARRLDTLQGDHLPAAPGLRVLLIGGAEPIGGMIADRLIAAGHRIAVQGVTISAESDRAKTTPAGFRTAEPISLDGDRSDAEEVVHCVARAEVALGGLDAVVVLPAGETTRVGLDVDAATWADEWSMALTTEVLAAACATHIAARSFLARRKAGRIVMVTNGRDSSLAAAMPTSATRAALSRLGADLTRELGPHGIGVSVVTTGPGGLQDFAVAQVADVVEALLSTPVLSGVSSAIG